MRSNLYVSAAPGEEPVSLLEARTAARVSVEEEDTLLGQLIVSARQWGEAITGRAFVTQSWELKLPRFPDCAIELPKPPLVSVTSVKYLDTAGVEQTWAPTTGYIVTGAAAEMTRGSIEPAYGVCYPSTQAVPDAVRIIYVAGYGAAAAVPQGIKRALLYHIAEAYQNRERPDFSLAEDAIWPWVSVRFD